MPGSVSVQAWDSVAALEKEIVNHVADRRGERLRDGAEIVVLGPPNAGKSSLINAIAKRDVAIVTPEPGTTRDLIEVRLDLGGYPVTLVDTAGLREAEGTVEREGIRRAEERAAKADLVLWLPDVTRPEGISAPCPVRLPFGTKIDLIDSEAERCALSAISTPLSRLRPAKELTRCSRLLTGRIADELPAAEAILIDTLTPSDRPARLSWKRFVRRCADTTAAARTSRRGSPPCRRCALARITGRIDVEDLLDVIFRDFCIGK